MTYKEKVHSRYLQLVLDKIDVFRDMILALSEDAQNDAKGSAGDKHETALSMMHLEQEKLSVKLRECLEQKAVLEKIDAKTAGARISIGSLVTGNGVKLFVSAALPKISVDGTTVLALSAQSPLGQLLVGKTVGDSVHFNSTVYHISQVE